MEHQSAVAYGNHYKNNPFGFDFIIIHESAHEWFGNSISCSDHADLWIHEALGTYAEAIYLEEKMGKDMTQKYLNGQKDRIRGKYPMVGPLGVNFQSPDSDMYFKGTWMFHTLRSVVKNDALWFSTLKQFCLDFYHKNTNTAEVVNYFSNKLGAEIGPLMHYYLYQVELPTLAYQFNEGVLKYKWKNVPDEVHLPIDLWVNSNTKVRINPKATWQEMKLSGDFQVDLEHFLVKVEKQN
jgi:aminopeptidase N